ncbi:MAG TPA: Calx-beta domain-containing protein [Burkholderiales bacterium]|nr:Calx-beta domain-containing protein [Burkholderiales bacterium]
MTAAGISRSVRGAVWAVFTLALASRAAGQTAVTTYHNDLARTGLYASETVLNPGSVTPGRFGKRFSYALDGYSYGQPLYLPRLNIPGKGVHNVVFVATEHDSVYAFDADSNAGPGAGLLWHRSFISPAAGPNVTTISTTGDIGCDDLVPEIGISSTPVIDAANGTIYVLVRTKEPDPNAPHGNLRFVQRLHALNVATGLDKAHSPVEIQASVPGSCDGGSTITFDPLYQAQRPGLVLSRGVVYIAWASQCDINPPGAYYHGWVMGYNATTLAQVGTFVTTPNATNQSSNCGLAGIWQSGGAPAVDASGNLYLETGNGGFDASVGDYGDSFLKLSSGLAVSDYFTPADQAQLDNGDYDFGSSGPMLLPDQPGPHPHLAVGSGKEGTIFLVDRDNLGQFETGAGHTNGVVQELTDAIGSVDSAEWGMPAYWNGHVYYAASGDSLKDFTLSNGLLSTTPVSTSNETFGYPGPTPAVSANGSSDGIVWILDEGASSSGGPPGPAILRAYDATDVSHLLWSSDSRTSDRAPGATKFSTPTIANGRVYVAGYRELAVYGVNGVRFKTANFGVTEGGMARITVTRSAPLEETVSVTYTASDGTAVANQNYKPTTGTLTFGPNVSARTFTVQTLNDSVNKPGLTVLLSLSNPVGAIGLEAPDTAVLTIQDNDPAGQVAFSAAAYSVKESVGTATITVRRTGGTAGAVTVGYSASGGSATDGVDYQSTSGTLTFGPKETTKAFTVTILPHGAADDHTVNLVLSDPQGGASLGAVSSSVLTITSGTPTVGFSASTYGVSQGAKFATITVVRHSSTAGQSTVHYATSDGTATQGQDYQAASGDLTFKPKVSVQTFTVRMLSDSTVEGPQTVNLTLSSPTSAGFGVRPTATLVINSTSPTVHFSAAAYKVSQAQSKATIEVRRAGSTAGTVVVDYKGTDGTAISGTDYDLRPGTLTFGPGVTSRSFLVTILPDSVHDGDETVNLLLGTVTLTGAYLSAPSTAVLTITDTAPSRIQFSVADFVAGENDGTATITVTRTGATTTTVSADWTTVDLGSAQDGVNYTGSSGTISIPAGATQGTFSVPVLSDGPSNGNKRVGLHLSNPQGGAALGTLSDSTLWIADAP